MAMAIIGNCAFLQENMQLDAAKRVDSGASHSSLYRKIIKLSAYLHRHHSLVLKEVLPRHIQGLIRKRQTLIQWE